MPADKLAQLLTSPKFDFSQIWPGMIKQQTQISGEEGAYDSVIRLDCHDGTFSEFKVVSMDTKKFKFVFQSIKTDKFGLIGEEQQFRTTLRFRPVTFCGCPFIQALMDTKSDKTGNALARTEKTWVEWRTKWQKDISSEKIDEVRGNKIAQISDFLRNMQVADLVEKITNKVSFADVYIKNKTTEDVQSKSNQRLESKCVFGGAAGGSLENYTYKQA